MTDLNFGHPTKEVSGSVCRNLVFFISPLGVRVLLSHSAETLRFSFALGQGILYNVKERDRD